MTKLTYIILLLLLLNGCGGDSGSPSKNPWKGYDQNTEVPKGDPQFPPLTTSWVIDNVGVMSPEAIRKGHVICNDLKKKGIAEVVVLVQVGVKKPEDYATHYGRWLGLGKADSTVNGGQNGLVWLIRPDAKEKITVSVGRGLPKFTTIEYGQMMEEIKDYINFNNFDAGVLILLDKTAKKLQEIKTKK